MSFSIFNCLLYFFLFWYLDQIIPDRGDSWRPKRSLLCCLKKKFDTKLIEKEECLVNVKGIEVNGVSMKYGKVKSLDHVDLTIN